MSQRVLRLARLIFVCTALAACQTFTLPQIPLLPPSEAHIQVQANQTLALLVGDQQHQIITMLSLTPKEILLVGLTPTGQRLLSFSYNGSELVAEFSEALQKSPPPELIISMLQLAYWPSNSLQKYYKAPYTFEETATQRLLRYKGEQILEVTYLTNTNKTDTLNTHQARGPKTGQSLRIFYRPLALQLNISSLSAQALTHGTTP